MAESLRHVCIMSEQVNDGKLGLLSATTMLIGGMIGSAIFSLSGLTMAVAGPASVLSWLIAALVMLLYGMIISELASIFPRSGGLYIFPAKAFGGKAGQIWGWLSCWGGCITNCIAVAFSAIYVSTYLGVSIPALNNLQVPLAVGSVALCLILNAINFSTTGKINNVLVGFMALAMLVFVAVGFFGGQFDGSIITPFFTQGSGGASGFLSMVPTAMVGYGSVVSIAFMVSEIRDPNKNVSKSMLIAMVVVTALYALTIFATIGLVSTQFLAENPGMQYIPLYAACFTTLAGYPWLTAVVTAAAVLALITTMLVCMALTARSLQAAADDAILPKPFAKCSDKTGVPLFSTVIVAIVAGAVASFPQFTATMVSFGAIFSVFTIVVNIIALMVARKKNPYVPGNFRCPGGSAVPVISLILLLICNASDIINGSWVVWLYTAGCCVVGLIIYFTSRAGRGLVESNV